MFGNNPFGVRDLSVSTFANEMVKGMREAKQRQEEKEFKKELLKLEQDKIKLEERQETLFNAPTTGNVFGTSVGGGTRQIQTGVPDPPEPQPYGFGSPVDLNIKGNPIKFGVVQDPNSGHITLQEFGPPVPTAEKESGRRQEIELRMNYLKDVIARNLPLELQASLFADPAMLDEDTKSKLQTAFQNAPKVERERIMKLMGQISAEFDITSDESGLGWLEDAEGMVEADKRVVGGKSKERKYEHKKGDIYNPPKTYNDLKGLIDKSKMGTGKKETKTVVRTGTMNGKKVIQYSDGSVEYAR